MLRERLASVRRSLINFFKNFLDRRHRSKGSGIFKYKNVLNLYDVCLLKQKIHDFRHCLCDPQIPMNAVWRTVAVKQIATTTLAVTHAVAAVALSFTTN